MSQHETHDHSVRGSSRPAKRVRTDHYNGEERDRSYRTRSPQRERWRHRGHAPYRGWSDRRTIDSYRTTDTYRPSRPREGQRERSASPGRNISAESQSYPKNKKTLKERKENPSTRIHSLRKLLERGRLPATVQQEKERELASLLFDQQKELIKQDGKKNLRRYHFVRFVERQKAGRVVKQLKKRQEQGDDSEALKKDIHEAEVDLNYTLYTPLAHKYISIYARDDGTNKDVRPFPRNLSKMSRKDYAILDQEQRNQIEELSMETAGALTLANNGLGIKPPGWYVVEEKMKEGQSALEALRDEQAKVIDKSEMTLGVRPKNKPDWLDDDGMIDPQDLDSDSDEDNDGVATGTNKDDGDMSDGDGGFFEKR